MDAIKSSIQEPINSEQDDQEAKNFDDQNIHSQHSCKSYRMNQSNQPNQQQGQINGINTANSIKSNKDDNCLNQDKDNDESFSSQSKRGFNITLILTGLCAIYILQDIFTRNAFADGASKSFIISIQKWSINTEFFYTLSTIISDSSFVITGLMIACVVIWGQNRIYTFNYIIIFAFTSGLFNLLKLIYNDPRPYMVYDQIQGKECSAEYGNPSGHAMLNLFAAIYGISSLGNQFHKKYWWACIIYGIFLVWVGFTRIILGVHGVNQVLLGWTYALFIFLIFRIILFKQVNRFIIKLAVLPKKKVKKYVFFCLALYVLVNGIFIGAFEGVKQTYQTENDNWNNNIKAACDTNDIGSISNKYLYNKCFIDGGVFGVSFGFLFGIIFTQGNIENCNQYGQFQSQITYLMVIKRLFLIAIAPGSIFGTFQLIFHFISADATYSRYFFQINIIGFICAFLVIYLSPKLLHRFQLDIKGDFLKIDSDLHSYSTKKSSYPVDQKRIIHFNANIDFQSSSPMKNHNTISQKHLSVIECQIMDADPNNISQNQITEDNSYKNYIQNYPSPNKNQIQNEKPNKCQSKEHFQHVNQTPSSNHHSNHPTNSTYNSNYNYEGTLNKSIKNGEYHDDSSIQDQDRTQFNSQEYNLQNQLIENSDLTQQQLEKSQESQQVRQVDINDSLDEQIRATFIKDLYHFKNDVIIYSKQDDE
ncbi:hypothetical protein ABPG72_001309 [Tetrahymena utriculariae]